MGTRSDSSNLFDTGTTLFQVTIILTLGRMWMDIFILAVNCRDWMKKKHLSITDKILTLQVIVKIYLGCVNMLWHLLAQFCPWITQIDSVFKVFMASLAYFTACNLWLTASLCSYYCVKIADFRHPFFIRLKLRLPGLVTIWLLGSMILSLASSLPYVSGNLEIECSRNLSHFFRNENETYVTRLLPVQTLPALACSITFTICATSAVLLLFSFWRHHQRMVGSWDGHRSPQTNTHFQAVVIILSLFIKNIFVSGSLLLVLSSDLKGNCIVTVAAFAVLHSFFLVESLISLWSNRKLRNEFRKALHFVKCRGCTI